MEPLINKEENKENKKKTCLFYSSIILAFVGIILGISCFARKIDTRVKIMEFPSDQVRDDLVVGDVVSLDSNGKLRKGAGTTVYRNIQQIHNKTLYHLHTAVIGDTIHIAQYDSEMIVSVVNPDTDEIIATETFPLPLVKGKAHRVDDILILNGNVVLSFGDNHAIPARVQYINNKIEVEFGEITWPYSLSTIQPEIMNLNESCVICSYYGVQNRITLVAGCLTDNLSMVWGENVEYSDDYIFHDIVGFTGERFMVVHARVPWWSAAEGRVDILERQRHPEVYATDSHLHYALGYVYPNLTVSVGPIMTIEKDSFGFMDMAHLDDHTAALSFINESGNNGMTSVLFKFDPSTDTLLVSGMINHQNGNGSGKSSSGLYSFIRTRAFSPTRFGLYYSDLVDCSATVLSIVDVTPAGDMQLFGPEFVIAPPSVNMDKSYFWTNLAPTTHERFFVMESLTVRDKKLEPYASIHVGEIYASPIGVVNEVSSKKVSVIVDGIFKKENHLTPGKEYMGNSNGQLVEGDYVGEINRDSYPLYVEKDGQYQILTTENQVGFALSQNELFVRVPDYIEVSIVFFNKH